MSVRLEEHLRRVREHLRSRSTPLRKRLGQHLLLDPSILRRIVGCSPSLDGHTVVEVGPGPGTLTAALLEAGARVHALEVDERWAQFLDRELRCEELRVQHVDAAADRARALRESLSGEPARSLISNLPYQVASPLLVEASRVLSAPATAVVTVQKEVARRLQAPPGSRQRGLLSLLVQQSVRVERCFDLPAGAFQPPPKVTSTVLRLVPQSELADREVDRSVREELWRAAFQGRRKMLRAALRRSFPGLVAWSETGAVADSPEADSGAVKPAADDPARLRNVLQRRPEQLHDEEWEYLVRAARRWDRPVDRRE